MMINADQVIPNVKPLYLISQRGNYPVPIRQQFKEQLCKYPMGFGLYIYVDACNIVSLLIIMCESLLF